MEAALFVQIKTDNQIKSDAEANARLEERVRDKLKRYEQRLSHVEVHVSDVNGGKGGDATSASAWRSVAAGHATDRRPCRRASGRDGGDRCRRQGRAGARSCARQAEGPQGPLRLALCRGALSDTARRMIRVASYNMRKAIGTDRKRRPERTIDVLNELDADVVALQEADRRFGIARQRGAAAHDRGA